ncbi:MAG TPA: hypothetical protein VGJ22_10450, partial [Anaerolineales bacterium]
MLLTLIPLTLVAGAAYIGVRTLLQDQAVSQMQTMISQQIKQVELSLKVKSIRLERLVHRPDLAAELEQALHANPQSPDFEVIRSRV